MSTDTLAETTPQAAISFDSGTERVALVELFTSEGCSSCPPADDALATLRNDAKLFKDYVPLAWHVDYWDKLGWTDKFADPAYTKRQYQLLTKNGRSGAYTPNFIIAGNEWRGFFAREPISKGVKSQPQTQPGRLQVSLEGDNLSAKFMPTASLFHSRSLQLNVARFGNDMVSQIQAGENRGRELTHEFVALSYDRAELAQTHDAYTASVSISDPRFASDSNGIVAWVSEKNDPTPIQVVGGYLSN